MPPHGRWACRTPATPTRAATTTQRCRLPPTRCASSIGPCACPCSRASSPHRARRCPSPAPCTTPTHYSGTTGLSASRPARPPRPAAASPFEPSAGSTASGRRSPGSCWASPARTRSWRVSRPPTPWSTASPAIGLRQIYSNEPRHYELHSEAIDQSCASKYADPSVRLRVVEEYDVALLAESPDDAKARAEDLRRGDRFEDIQESWPEEIVSVEALAVEPYPELE